MLVAICTGYIMWADDTGAGAKADRAYFYLGTYTTTLEHVDGQSRGITLWSVDLETGQMEQTGGPWPIVNSSHMCLGKDRIYLYSISETLEYNGKKDGCLTIFKIDPGTMALTELDTVSSHGVGPAYVSTDQTGNYLFLANYVAGNVVVYPIENRGMPGPATANLMHEGSSVNKSRQKRPHPHSMVASPDNRFVYAPDLGLDKIKVYAFDHATGKLTARPDLDSVTLPGAGPRHLVFHTCGKYAYMTLELTCRVAAYSYSEGKLTELGVYDMLPAGFTRDSTSAEIRVSPDGKLVYTSNRGHDSIAVFEVNPSNGTLDRIQLIGTGGRIPRNFALDPGGSILVAGNQDSHNMLTYKIDPASGKLTPTGHKVDAKSPAFFCFY